MIRYFTLLLVLCSSLLGEDKEGSRKALDETFLTAKLWTQPLEEIQKSYGETMKVKVVLDPELRRQISESGHEVPEMFRSVNGFEWLSSAQKAIRAPGGQFSLMGLDVGEIVVRGKGGKVGNASLSIFNRGDDGTMLRDDYDALMRQWKSGLDDKLKERPEERHKAGAVSIDGWMWKKGRIVFLLEGSVTKKTNRVEFVRLRMGYADSMEDKKEVKRRGSLDDNVVEKENGDVLVTNVPMVDQGEKGYCVVASVERVARYFGLDVDQHELAQLADTSAEGTYPDKMEKAFKRLTGRIHVRTLKLMDYDYKQTVSDYKAYEKEARKQGAETFDIDLDRSYIIAQGFWANLNPEIFKVVKAREAKYDFFKRKTKEFVDQGVPICWTLYLGMFKEGDMPQSRGGHMRLIVGYNEEKEEVLYTDSWGEGHELKRMPAIEAWCMTTGMYAMVPNR
ncbi:MAG: C39 family peptidase [Verrucomicrobiaceae bacterium]